jgi:hypothetical protein
MLLIFANACYLLILVMLNAKYQSQSRLSLKRMHEDESLLRMVGVARIRMISAMDSSDSCSEVWKLKIRSFVKNWENDLFCGWNMHWEMRKRLEYVIGKINTDQ